MHQTDFDEDDEMKDRDEDLQEIEGVCMNS